MWHSIHLPTDMGLGGGPGADLSSAGGRDPARAAARGVVREPDLAGGSGAASRADQAAAAAVAAAQRIAAAQEEPLPSPASRPMR